MLAKKIELQKQKKAKEEEAAAKFAALNIKVKSVGNYVHPSVPISNNEDDNAIVRTWVPEGMGEPKHLEGGLPHHGVLARIDGYDPERGVKVVGHRGYCRLAPFHITWWRFKVGTVTTGDEPRKTTTS